MWTKEMSYLSKHQSFHRLIAQSQEY
jgi:hypothetical protein